MAFAFSSRRPQCFYCGKRSSHRIFADAEQFECEGCLAVNYFDENGEITDPPTSISNCSIQSPIRYARAQSRSPPLSDKVFCDTCIKNQYLYKENLALYLPESQHPRYREYVDSLPSYKARLEERYPQVCSDCAPRARDKIKQAGYVAKTDHLRRMMAQTRTGKMPLRTGVWWRLWTIRLGGFGWWSSGTAQILWHLLGAMAQSHQERPVGHTSQEIGLSSLVMTCSRQGWRTFMVDPYCVECSSAYVPSLLLLSILTVWWNPHLSEKYLRQRKGRMRGLVDYTIQCIIILVFRAVGWAALRNPQLYRSDHDIYKAGHIFMTVFIAFSMIYGSTIVKLDTNPIISFHVPDDQILPGIPKRDPEIVSKTPSLQTGQNSLSWATSTTSMTGGPMQDAFQAQIQQTVHSKHVSDVHYRSAISREGSSISNFAEQNSSTSEKPWSDPDAMDWSPSEDIKGLTVSNFRPRLLQESQQPIFAAGQSPFQTRVPAAPPNRMRHPREHAISPTVQPFKKASEAQRQSFLNGMAETRNGKSLNTQSGLGSSLANASTTGNMTENRGLRNDVHGSSDALRTSELKSDTTNTGIESGGDFRLAPQRLFLKSDERDTGLESMFDEVFSFHDEPSANDAAGASLSTSASPHAKQQTSRGSGVFGLDTHGQLLSDGWDPGRQRAVGRSDLWSSLIMGFVPAVILGMAAVVVKFLPLRGEERLHEL